MTKVITTKKGFSCTVDPEDYEIVSKYSWHVINGLFATNMMLQKQTQSIPIRVKTLLHQKTI